METLLQGMKAAAEATRLRILGLCAHAELTVSDLVNILGQSQPRVSRHLRLLVEAGLLERYQEGNWAYYRLAEEGDCAALAHHIIDLIPEDDPALSLDLVRLEEVRAARAERAAEYFRRNAAQWDEIRALYVDEEEVEAALERLALQGQPRGLLDIGTGTGRILERLAPEVESAVGVDDSREMLAVARNKLDEAGLRNCHVRLADMYQLPFHEARFDVVTCHMVLHYAENPGRVITEAARVLKPGGKLIIVDFAPHEMEHLMEQHEHRWLGFADETIEEMLRKAGLNAGAPVRLAGGQLTVCLWPGTRAANVTALEPKKRKEAQA